MPATFSSLYVLDGFYSLALRWDTNGIQALHILHGESQIYLNKPTSVKRLYFAIAEKARHIYNYDGPSL